MPGVNFGSISSSSPADTATEPRKIFTALPRKDAKYSYPRDVQAQVWDKWHDARQASDLVIKMNTGGGKTVVGLMALKSSLNEKVGPAVYLTPSRLLTSQVVSEASALGIETTEEPRDAKFRQGRAILVTNIYKMFNGLSQFGVEGGSRSPIDVGTILIDDAHACLDIMQQQFSISLSRDHSAYKEMLALIIDDLRAQSTAKALEVSSGDPTATMYVPWWAWRRETPAITQILHQHREDPSIKFAWPLISDSIQVCSAAISGAELVIAPPIPPVDAIPSFRSAQRRIYLSATLNDDSVLVTHFGASPEQLAGPITPSTAGDIGDRLILTPYETHRGVQESEVMELLSQLSQQVNVVVIVPSYRRSEEWNGRADAIHNKDSIDDGVRALREGHVGLAVLVGRYDGIDLPGDACRVLVLDGLPETHSALEQMESSALLGSPTLLQRQLRRVEQGMGRGVRSNDDYCVVMLLGSRLTERLYVTDAEEHFSPATYAQLSLSQKVARMIEGESFSEVRSVIDQVLNRDVEWIAANRQVLEDLVYDDELQISPAAVSVRKAFELARQGRHEDAANELHTTATRHAADQRESGWIMQQAAAYMDHADPVRAQKIQAKAKELNLSLLKPQSGLRYRKISGAVNQASRATEFLSESFSSTDEMVLSVRAVLSDLRPSDRHTDVEAFEEGFANLGRLLGFRTQRPEKEVGNGPDVLWLLAADRYWVVECKSGVTNDFISRSDIEQLSHSMDWFSDTYGDDSAGTPVLVHPSGDLHPKAFARPGAVVLTLDRLAPLKSAVESMIVAFAAGGDLGDAEAYAEQLRTHGLLGGELAQRWCVTPVRPA